MHGTWGTTGSEGVSSCGKELDLPHSFFCLYFPNSKPGSRAASPLCSSALSEFSGIKLKAASEVHGK